ncbi:MAG TPA: hypothetical protein VIJ79_05295 [Acidobacteriaceae bacterium]
MITLNRSFQVARRVLALSAVLGMSVAIAHAQQADAPAINAQPTLNFQLPVSSAAPDFSSSAASNDSAAVSVADSKSPFDFLAVPGTQPPPRRSYGRPRYRGGNQNADGSDKYTFIAGVGFTIPTGDLSNELTPSYSVQVGGGRNFNKIFGVLAQFDWDNFGFQGSTLNNQEAIYNDLFGAGAVSGLDGTSHIWSLTLNPVINIPTSGSVGAYVVGGVGFYHKTANFMVSALVQGYDEFGYPIEYSGNESIDKYTSNAPGFNGGFGLTYKMSQFSNERFYAEVRYVYVDSQQKAGFTLANIDSATATSTNFYPANSNHSTYIPVKFGIRF